MTRTAFAIARARRARRLGLSIEPLLDGDRRLWVPCPVCAEHAAKRTGTRCLWCLGAGAITAEAMAARLEWQREQEIEEAAFQARRAAHARRVLADE